MNTVDPERDNRSDETSEREKLWVPSEGNSEEVENGNRPEELWVPPHSVTQPPDDDSAPPKKSEKPDKSPSKTGCGCLIAIVVLIVVFIWVGFTACNEDRRCADAARTVNRLATSQSDMERQVEAGKFFSENCDKSPSYHLGR